MGWEGIHLFQFRLRAARYGSSELSAASPDVSLASFRLRSGGRFVYEYDLGTPPLPSGTDVVHLLTAERHLLLPASHQRASDPVIDLRDLSGDTWIASKESPLLHRMCTSAGFEPRIAHRTDDFHVMHEFVRHGLGIALVPELGYVPIDGIASVPLSVAAPTRRVYAVHRRFSENPLLGQLIEALRTGVREFRLRP